MFLDLHRAIYLAVLYADHNVYASKPMSRSDWVWSRIVGLSYLMR